MSKNTPIKLKVILGSTRKGRFGDKPAFWIHDRARKVPNVEVEMLDLRDFPLPFFNLEKSPSSNPRKYEDDIAAKWSKKIDETDAFIIVTPEYNHGYPAVLKNALDFAYVEWNKKPVGFVSYGSVAGARAVEQLRQVAIELQMAPIRKGLHIPAPWGLLDEKGNLKKGAFDNMNEESGQFLDQLLWWAKALKAAR